MGAGREYGGRAPVLSVGLFVDDEGGYTSVAMVIALLLSLTLVFSLASAEWALARSADVQEVADAAALAGSNCVAGFSTVVQVTDACVLSLGLAGLLTVGAGMVVAAIPFVQAESPTIIEAGRQILDARRTLADTASQGISKLEQALPALIMANSASCVAANSRRGIQYVGCAVPFPQTSNTDYGFLQDELSADEMEASAERLREATERKEEALKKANAAKERAWRADCVDEPMCMRSRAETLAGLWGSVNPNYPTVDQWQFGYARIRAINYYAARINQESPESMAPEELSRSAARAAFYRYAYDAIAASQCVEGDYTYIDLPELPHNRATVRESSLYTDVIWPCTQEEQGRTLHSTLACPGAPGPSDGASSLADLEQGMVLWCDTCGMDVSVMGHAADASTNIDNGFEHYWRIVVWASRDYAAARQEAEEAEREMGELAQKSSDFFKEAMEMLSVNRPSYIPAGAWGCVSVVVRGDATTVPHELTSAFLTGAALPPGAAISAATLAPDEATTGNTVLSRALDGLKEHWGSPVEMVGSVADLWGKLLLGYGSAYKDVTGVASDLMGNIGTLFGEKVATWLQGKLSGMFGALSIEPADMRLRKPVLVKSQRVLDKVGLSTLGQARELIESLPGSVDELIDGGWRRVLSALGVEEFTIAELPIPGMGDLTIPLTIDLSSLGGVA